MSGRKAKLSLPTEFRDAAVMNMRERALELIEGSNPVFIDAQRTQSIDTAGLQFLLRLSQTLHAQEREVTWSQLSPEVESRARLGGFLQPLGVGIDSSAA